MQKTKNIWIIYRMPFIKIDGYGYFTFYLQSNWSEALLCCNYVHGNVMLFIYIFLIRLFFHFRTLIVGKTQFISARVWSSILLFYI